MRESFVEDWWNAFRCERAPRRQSPKLSRNLMYCDLKLRRSLCCERGERRCCRMCVVNRGEEVTEGRGLGAVAEQYKTINLNRANAPLLPEPLVGVAEERPRIIESELRFTSDTPPVRCFLQEVLKSMRFGHALAAGKISQQSIDVDVKIRSCQDPIRRNTQSLDLVRLTSSPASFAFAASQVCGETGPRRVGPAASRLRRAVPRRVARGELT